MNVAVAALIVLGALGGLFGIVLAVSSRIFRVEVDERIERIHEALPGVNCGGCGYPGCFSYAEALVMEGAEPGLCAPGGSDTAEKIGEILGLDVGESVTIYPIVRCQGSDAELSFEYDGIPTCEAASILQGGFKQCTAGCLGLGDCVRACPVDAITMKNGIPEIDEEICISCGTCAEICPRDIIEMRPADHFVHVLCLNTEKGKAAKSACPASCIACRKCEKECPFDAIHVIDNLAVIDYEKCRNCGKCVKVCPMEVIVNLRKERKSRAADKPKPQQEKEPEAEEEKQDEVV